MTVAEPLAYRIPLDPVKALTIPRAALFLRPECSRAFLLTIKPLLIMLLQFGPHNWNLSQTKQNAALRVIGLLSHELNLPSP